MKNPEIKEQDTFQEKIKIFKKLLVGAKMAKISAIGLAVLSIILAYQARDNSIHVMLLLTGALVNIVFAVRFLSLKEIQQKSYTQTSLMSSISKFREYISNRKKYEIYYLIFWMLTLIPSFTAHSGYSPMNIPALLFCFAIVVVFGYLAFKKIDKVIEALD